MKSVFTAILIFIISFVLGNLAASDKSRKFYSDDMSTIKISTRNTASDQCYPDDFIVSKINKISKIKDKADINSFNSLMNEIKVMGIREIESESGAMAIHALCKIGDTKALEKYLNSGVCSYHINSRDKNGLTPLVIAAQNMDFKTLKVLLEFGADKKQTAIINGKERDLIQVVLDHKGYDFQKDVDVFLKIGINFEPGEKYLTQAIVNGKLNFLKQILPRTDVNAITESGEHIFTEVLKTGKYREATDYFLNNKDLALHNASSGCPPLIAAVENSSIKAKDIMKMIEKGADINLADSRDNSTALIASVKANRADLVEVLIKNGAETDIRDINGKTARDYIKDKNSKVSKLILSVSQH